MFYCMVLLFKSVSPNIIPFNQTHHHLAGCVEHSGCGVEISGRERVRKGINGRGMLKMHQGDMNKSTEDQMILVLVTGTLIELLPAAKRLISYSTEGTETYCGIGSSSEDSFGELQSDRRSLGNGLVEKITFLLNVTYIVNIYLGTQYADHHIGSTTQQDGGCVWLSRFIVWKTDENESITG